MVLLVFFAMAYGAAQIFIIASPTRSISWRLALLALFTGFSASAGLALAAQHGSATLLSALMNVSRGSVIRSGSYLLDPFIEEIAKPLPLAVLMLFSRVRKGLTATDAVVLCAALGSGFGFTEAALTVASDLSGASRSGGYWHALLNFMDIYVPGPITSLTSWLPAGFTVGGQVPLNFHLAWSSVVGLGAALAFKPGKMRWVGLALLAFASLDHATSNANIQSVRFPLGLSSFFDWARRYTAFYPILALAVAFGLDRRRLLERLKSLPSIKFGKKAGTPLPLTGGRPLYQRARAAIGIALAVPSLLYFATCGFPHFDWVRQFLASGSIFPIVRTLLAVGLAFQTYTAASLALALARQRPTSSGSLLLVRGLSLSALVGGLIQGLMSLITSIGKFPLSPISQAHVLEHWLQANPLTAVMLGIALMAILPASGPLGGLAATAVLDVEGAMVLAAAAEGEAILEETAIETAILASKAAESGNSNLPPQQETAASVLKPNSEPIGTPSKGGDPTIRDLPGGQEAAEKIYEQLSQGGTPLPETSNYPGKGVKFPNGDFVGIRDPAQAKSGISSIDVNFGNVPEVEKLKFPDKASP